MVLSKQQGKPQKPRRLEFPQYTVRLHPGRGTPMGMVLSSGLVWDVVKKSESFGV